MKAHERLSCDSVAAPSASIRGIALFEATKGVIVLMAASGLLLAIHENVHVVAAKLIEHFHLNPASHYPHIFLDALSNLHDRQLIWLAVGAFAYAFLRFVEVYGLYTEKTWAEVLEAASGAIYIPFELASLFREPTWLSALFLVVNLFIVAVMARALLQRRKQSRRPLDNP